MRRIQYHRYGGPEEMRLESYELAAPDGEEIVVQVKAAAINPFDWKVRQGAMKFMVRAPFPHAMGTDFSGVVESVGAAVMRFRSGDEVLGTAPLGPAGAFAEKLITKQKLILKKPASLSFEEAAILPAIGVTAWRALVLKGKLKPGHAVFVNGALGGVGQAAVFIAKALGASVVAGRVGPHSLDAAKTIGIDPILDYTKDIPPGLDNKFDIVFDCNGSLTPRQADALAKRDGIVLDTNPTTYKFLRSLFSRRHKFVFGSPSAEILQNIVDLPSAGKFRISINRTARLEQGIQLIGDFEAGRLAQGKAVIVMP
jgi:NADPH:quinone reductase-like Zn-dependent oxidoreductase